MTRAVAAVLLLSAATACGGRAAVPGAAVSSLPGVAESSVTAKNLYATLVTDAGEIELRLLRAQAPKAAERFAALARGEGGRPLYDGARFERTVPGYLLQCGEPAGSAPRALLESASGRPFSRAGAAAFAGDRAEPVGAQFFLTLSPAPWLEGRHAAFGEVVRGLEVARAIAAAPRRERGADGALVDRPLVPARILRVKVEER